MVKGNTQSKYTLVKDEIEADDNPVGFGIGAVGPVTDHDWDRIFNWIREQYDNGQAGFIEMRANRRAIEVKAVLPKE